MEQTNEIQTNPQTESIKLVRNSKGYNWEIRILSTDINYLEKLNNEMVEKFGRKKTR